MIGLIHTANIYTEDGDGRYTIQAKAGLVCRVARVGFQPGRTSAERAELAAERLLMWDEDYTLPRDAEVESGGVRYNVQVGTDHRWAGPSGAYHHSSVILTRQQET